MVYFGQDKMSEFYYGGTEIKEMYLNAYYGKEDK